ncbi:hypothetical protein BD410DRAFT_822410 [Rickenella mellea]|uniref:Uncharacterized protein n=1 Tax=Rickenella mellea TaxID=50990 RepID=A0A4Y7PTM7_9AGAM|nr:hypothetical protein BD410DRAFT_822410 [Rickenella mellea]
MSSSDDASNVPTVTLDVDRISGITAARLAICLLGHVLYLKNQVPFPVPQLHKMKPSATDAHNRATKKQEALLAAFDLLSSHLGTTFTALSTALARCKQYRDSPRLSRPPATAHLLFMLGPSATAVNAAKARVLLEVAGLDVKVFGERDDGGGGHGEECDSDDGDADGELGESSDEEDDDDEKEATPPPPSPSPSPSPTPPPSSPPQTHSEHPTRAPHSQPPPSPDHDHNPKSNSDSPDSAPEGPFESSHAASDSTDSSDHHDNGQDYGQGYVTPPPLISPSSDDTDGGGGDAHWLSSSSDADGQPLVSASSDEGEENDESYSSSSEEEPAQGSAAPAPQTPSISQLEQHRADIHPPPQNPSPTEPTTRPRRNHNNNQDVQAIPIPSISLDDEQSLKAAERLLSRALAEANGNAKVGFSDEISPTQTHILLRAPRRFDHPAWLPLQNYTRALDGVLQCVSRNTGEGAQAAGKSYGRSGRKGGVKTDVVRVRCRGERGDGDTKNENEEDEEAEMIWWHWDGKLVGYAD